MQKFVLPLNGFGAVSIAHAYGHACTKTPSCNFV